MIEVVLSRLGLDSKSKAYVVVLQERGGVRLLPIWIGEPEAESIVMHVQHIKRPRPFTHDLCQHIIRDMGGTLERIQITKVENSTYYAELHIVLGSERILLDARPSDSIAIALRMSAPMFADESLLAEYDQENHPAIDISGPELPEKSSERLTADELKAFLEGLRPEDLGEFNI